MGIQWQQMGVMEPDWYAPDLAVGSPALLMNWDETEWILCTQIDDGYRRIWNTGTGDIDEAKKRADKWLADNQR